MSDSLTAEQYKDLLLSLTESYLNGTYPDNDSMFSALNVLIEANKNVWKDIETAGLTALVSALVSNHFAPQKDRIESIEDLTLGTHDIGPLQENKDVVRFTFGLLTQTPA